MIIFESILKWASLYEAAGTVTKIDLRAAALSADVREKELQK